jgi:hypothetical protein
MSGDGAWAPEGGRRLRRAGLALWALLGVCAPPVRAHHSFAAYDSEHQIKLTGTVVSFIWSNPHVYIQVAVQEERGTRNTYTLECASPAILQREGWHLNVIKVGEQVSVIIAPLRNGDPGGLLKELILPDGRRLSDGALVGEPSID